ncbi:MAG: hypothetical protein JSR80_02540 [Verrucomicrobia bacterium]|nr:hypothetical protein [Verrucomicrobiota bacterium]
MGIWQKLGAPLPTTVSYTVYEQGPTIIMEFPESQWNQSWKLLSGVVPHILIHEKDGTHEKDIGLILTPNINNFNL